jgi:hypothetical protein
MLSPLLESLVLSNQATVKTHNHGVGGVGSIVVPKGKQIIITQIIWHPFVDANEMVAIREKLFDDSGSFMHTLKIRNKANRYAFTFRDTINPFIMILPGGGGRTYYAPAKAQIIDTYLPFTEGLVEFDIMKFNTFSDWIVYRDFLPGKTIEPDAGEGYGNINSPAGLSFETVETVGYYGFVLPPYKPTTYLPPTSDRLGYIPNPNSSNEFEGSIPLTPPPNWATIPPEPNPENTDISMFPVITFTYVEINTRYVPGNTSATVDYNKK